MEYGNHLVKPLKCHISRAYTNLFYSNALIYVGLTVMKHLMEMTHSHSRVAMHVFSICGRVRFILFFLTFALENAPNSETKQ